jgi:hypothetical protein
MVHENSLAAATTRESFCGDLTANDERNMRRYNGWLLAWMGVWMAARFLVEWRGEQLAGVLGWGIAALTVVPGVLAIGAYVRFLREADELLRKIQLEALALAFGVGTLFMMTWRLVEKVGGPQLDVNDAVVLMFVVWIGAQWLGARRYR